MKNIIITGGELFNKGAQAMTFIAVDECKKRFPDHEIYVFSEMDLRRPREEREQYAFHFTGWYPEVFAKCQSNPLLRAAYMLRNGKELRACEQLYRNCNLMIDVSGYGLGSVFGINQLKTYINHLVFAKAFQIPCYLMPQTFGPFNFTGQKEEAARNLKDLLSNVRVICAREKEGYEQLIQNYHLNNVQMLPDIVLNNKGIDPFNVYKTKPITRLPEIEKNSIAIIPNSKIAILLGEKKALEIYESAIESVLKLNRKVYLISHATDDIEFCYSIKENCNKDQRVIFVERDLNCFEFSELASKFLFIIASRFHSIIHAYKTGVPCIVIGWAAKYDELLVQFEQNRYAFNASEESLPEKIDKAVEIMSEQAMLESVVIQKHLNRIQQNNVFDIIMSK